MINNQKQAHEPPLLDAVIQQAREQRVAFHMPGHARGSFWPAWFRDAMPVMDVTELAHTDDINWPSGPARKAMTLASDTWGSGTTRLITSGSTTALHIMLALAVGRCGSLLVSRTCHQAAVHASSLLSINLFQYDPSGYLSPDKDLPEPRLTLFPQATVYDIEHALREHPDCRAVLVTSPDYYGCCAALRSIADVAHAYGALLLVDEAHGAHFVFGPDYLPETALVAGADACVQSAHKTLPVLTGGAFIHLGKDALAQSRLSVESLDRLVPVFQTSSPSLLIAASLDYARSRLVIDGSRQVSHQYACLEELRAGLPEYFMCHPLKQKSDPSGLARDPLRLVITTRDPSNVADIPLLTSWLARHQIDIEFSDLTRIILIPSLWQKRTAWDTLGQVLKSFAASGRKTKADPAKSAKRMKLEQSWRYHLKPLQQACPRENALFDNLDRCRVPLQSAPGRISTQCLVPYPPGIPLVWPGERLDQERVDFLSQLLENDININGIDSGTIPVLA
jgi:arginine/lysine/ornithine decarboxylase